jgi:hypothetical protein
MPRRAYHDNELSRFKTVNEASNEARKWLNLSLYEEA